MTLRAPRALVLCSAKRLANASPCSLTRSFACLWQLACSKLEVNSSRVYVYYIFCLRSITTLFFVLAFQGQRRG